jgi:hypothetical protein
VGKRKELPNAPKGIRRKQKESEEKKKPEENKRKRNETEEIPKHL